MGMFGDQLQRLLRTKWKSPVALAQEIYSMLGSIDEAVTASTPTTVSPPNQDSGPATIYDDWGPLQPITTIRRPDGSTVAMTPSGFTLDGELIPDMAFSPSHTPPADQQGGGDAGTIRSGDGSSYQVQLVSGKTVSATQGQIADGETIPAGTFVLLAKVKGKYYMQVPVWLDDLP